MGGAQQYVGGAQQYGATTQYAGGAQQYGATTQYAGGAVGGGAVGGQGGTGLFSNIRALQPNANANATANPNPNPNATQAGAPGGGFGGGGFGGGATYQLPYQSQRPSGQVGGFAATTGSPVIPRRRGPQQLQPQSNSPSIRDQRSFEFVRRSV